MWVPSCNAFLFFPATYPNETFLVSVEADLMEGLSFPVPGYDPTPSLVPIFKCIFDQNINTSYVFDVHWYINGDNITLFKNVPYDYINTTAMKETDWINTHKMNMEVCAFC